MIPKRLFSAFLALASVFAVTVLVVPNVLAQSTVSERAFDRDSGWNDAYSKGRGLFAGVGVSINRWEPWNALATVRSGHIDAVQVIYNVFDQNPEDELLPACVENDVAVIARVPFDEGTLTGTLTRDSTWPEGDWRNTYFVPENLAASVERAEALAPLVPDDATMPEMALRFILGHDAVATTIPGMRKLRHVEANMTASERGPLDQDLRRRLRDHRWDRKPTDWSQ